jgi:hypothetical protein
MGLDARMEQIESQLELDLPLISCHVIRYAPQIHLAYVDGLLRIMTQS